MNFEDEHVVSDVFDVTNSVDTQIFALDSDQLKSSLPYNNLCDNYLRENIGEPLSSALAYVIIYRPGDAIEFIAIDFLIDWSRKKARQKLIDQETNNILAQCFIDEQQKKEVKHLLNEEDFHINSHKNDEQESSNYFQEQKQQPHRTNISHYIHTHDTASGFDDDKMKSTQENNKSHICHDGNLSSFTYFSKLRDKIIKCDES